MITWTTVESSAIARIGYDGKNLFIKFVGKNHTPGSTYEYFNVPELVYTELLQARSKGAYHDEFIMGRYRYQKMPPIQPSSTQFYQHDVHK